MLRTYPFLDRLFGSRPTSDGHASQTSPLVPVAAPRTTTMCPTTTANSQLSTSGSSQHNPNVITADTKVLDVASLLAATHSWISENSVEGIAASILRVLLQNTGASYGCFAFKNERGLRLRAAGSVDELQVSGALRKYKTFLLTLARAIWICH
jgi:hypothetical protein